MIILITIIIIVLFRNGQLELIILWVLICIKLSMTEFDPLALNTWYVERNFKKIIKTIMTRNYY